MNSSLMWGTSKRKSGFYMPFVNKVAKSWQQIGAKGIKEYKSFIKKASKRRSQLLLYGSLAGFAEVLPKEKHIIGKKHTKKIEGINTWFRTRLRRLVRRTVCFSKKLSYHYSIMKTAIYEHNKQTLYI